MEAPERIKTTEAHYFVVVAKQDDNNFMLLSTTQLMSKYNFYKGKEDLNTLANIQPTETNGLTQSSYFDCNQKYEISTSELIQKVENGKLIPKGNLSQDEFEKILYSMSLSNRLDIPKFIIPKNL